MIPLLDAPRGAQWVQSLSLLRPPSPISLPALPHASVADLAEMATGDTLDSSTQRACQFVVGTPFFHFGESRKGLPETLFVTLIDRYLASSHRSPSLRSLGIPHATKLCEMQDSEPFLRLPGIRRLWFYGFCAYESYVELTPFVRGVTLPTGTGGGEIRPAMVRDADEDPWHLCMLPSYDYHSTFDRLAFGLL